MNLDPCLSSCTPNQIVSLKIPVNDITNIGVLGNDNCEYDRNNILYSYSLDSVTWSCFGNYSDIAKICLGLKSDFYLKIKVQGVVNDVIEDNNGEISSLEYTTQIAEGFKLDYSNIIDNSNIWNPYSNMEGALQLQEQMNELVSQMLGVQAYYFKLSPNDGSRDTTFKEYALMGVESFKLIKLIIKDSQLPSSKIEFSDFGLEFANDWEVEVTKLTFATAFGNNVQPTEGDLVYIPMMKRMWMVSNAYEEKNGALMWVATTFKLSLIKYQEKDSVDLGSTEEMVNSFVKNKYEDLFGDQETLDSGEESASTPITSTENMYPAYESDATRKWITVNNIDMIKYSLYYKGTLISDSHYRYYNPSLDSKIIYQRRYCGTSATVSFIIFPTNTTVEYDGVLLDLGTLQIRINQNKNKTRLYINDIISLNLVVGNYNFIWFRWSDKMNIIDGGVVLYTHPANIPQYALQNHHFYFDIDKPFYTKQEKYDIELVVEKESDIILHQFYGLITNIKIFDVYNDNLSEILQQYPTHQHLLVNDTARKLIDMHGPGIK